MNVNSEEKQRNIKIPMNDSRGDYAFIFSTHEEMNKEEPLIVGHAQYLQIEHLSPGEGRIYERL